MSLVLVTGSVLVAGCGGDHAMGGHGDQYLGRKVAQEDIEQVLKNDTRVEDFEVDGDRLIVNVRESWVSSPPGMKQLAMGQWFNQWKSGKGDAARVQVVVRYEGADVAKATASGIEFMEMKEAPASE
jgi:hypothetical protein